MMLLSDHVQPKRDNRVILALGERHHEVCEIDLCGRDEVQDLLINVVKPRLLPLSIGLISIGLNWLWN